MSGTEKMKNKIFRRFFSYIKMERLSVFEVVLFFFIFSNGSIFSTFLQLHIQIFPDDSLFDSRLYAIPLC